MLKIILTIHKIENPKDHTRYPKRGKTSPLDPIGKPKHIDGKFEVGIRKGIVAPLDQLHAIIDPVGLYLGGQFVAMDRQLGPIPGIVGKMRVLEKQIDRDGSPYKNNSKASRLPKRMSAAKNRSVVLKSIHELKRKNSIFTN
jgi:hypothetical protein